MVVRRLKTLQHYLHHMDIVQLLALLGDPLGAEPLPVGALSIAGAVVAVGHLPVLAHGDEALPPEADAGPLLQELRIEKR